MMFFRRRLAYLLLACAVLPLCIGTAPVTVMAKSLCQARSTEGESKPAEQNDQPTEQDNAAWLVNRRVRISTPSFVERTILHRQLSKCGLDLAYRPSHLPLSNASEHARRNGLGAPLLC
jgi:hypothetical protein